MRADLMGFPFPQDELIGRKDDTKIDPKIDLGLVCTTSSPPIETQISMEEVLRGHTWFLSLLNQQLGVQLVSEKADLKTTSLAFLLGLQWPPKDVGLRELVRLRELGVIFMGLAYELETEYGGGFATPDSPLTKRGQQFVEWLAEARMILDLSHAGHKTAREALAFIRGKDLKLPVVASHVGCYNVCPHLRNFPDDILLGILERDGIIGIPTVTWMLDEKRISLAPFFSHLGYALNLLGADNVVIGSDGVYKRLDPVEEEKRFEFLKSRIDPRGNFKARFPDQPPELNCPDRMTILEAGIMREFGESISRKVVGGNLFQFLSERLP